MKKFNVRKQGETDWYESVGPDVYEAIERYAAGPEGYTEESGIYEVQGDGNEPIKLYWLSVSFNYSAKDYKP